MEKVKIAFYKGLALGLIISIGLNVIESIVLKIALIFK